MKICINNKCANVELRSVEYGMEECAPSHSFGPAIRQYCLIHYVESGKGIFEINGRRHPVEAGQIFYIPPKVIIYYEADAKDPWTYKWIGIEGRGVEKAFENAGINADNAVMDAPRSLSETIDRMLARGRRNTDSLGITALAYEFMYKAGAIFGNTVRSRNGVQYVEEAKNYIRTRLHHKITVKEVSEYVNIDRSYLTALFRETEGICPRQYILEEKMKVACEYLSDTEYDVSYIAHSVGYEDLFVFSHAFKRVMGVSPAKYRKR